MAIYDAYGNLVPTGFKQTNEVLVASSDTSDEIKANTEYVCTGTNDEAVIQRAVNYIANNGGGVVKLSDGNFFIDSFPNTDSAGDYVAIMIPQKTNTYAIEILGAGLPYGTSSPSNKGCTRIKVSDSCYESLSASNRYTIIRGGYVASPIWQQKLHHLTLKDMEIRLPWNQKPITCLDLLYTNRVLVERVQFRGYTSGYNGHTVTVNTPPDIAVENCVGMRATSGSNNGILNDYRNMLASGFYEGFKLGGEHLIGINLASIFCYYGFTFGNYQWDGAFSHPMTLINCCDERGVNFPLFVDCGTPNGSQPITFIDFNLERKSRIVPGGTLGEYAVETTPNTFRGTINYTVSNDYGINDVTEPFWKDGSGHGFVTKNDAHELSGTSAVRRGYKPTYLQRFYDTTVGKMLWCIDTANKTWVDSQGNTVA